MDDIIKEIAYLNTLVSENKRDKIREVLKMRTAQVTVVLENIMQPHNGSAVIRTADIFGIQNLHVIEELAKFKAENSIAKGALKWVDIHKYKSTVDCIQKLKKDGYRIVATTPHEQGYTIQQLSIDQKIALFFGTEITGLSQTVIEQADDFVTIPMFGFTESFNISVSVALCLYELINKLHASNSAWHLTDREQQLLQLNWLRRVLHISK